jgi:hypothetical protein
MQQARDLWWVHRGSIERLRSMSDVLVAEQAVEVVRNHEGGT